MISKKNWLNELRHGAPYNKCQQRFFQVSSLLTKQIKLVRSLNIYESNQEQKLDISALKSSLIMYEILEPISNKQRLEILKTLATELKRFSTISKPTNLIAGNIFFHLQKLMDREIILQQHGGRDYIITEKGLNILQSLNEM